MRQAVESARMGWGLCTVAGVAGKGETLDIVPRFLITGRRVAGSSFGGVKGRDGVPQLVERWLAGDIDVESFISHRMTLDDVNRGFELMEAQDGIRSVIEFSMILERAEHPEWTSNAYLVADGDGGHGVLVDSNGVEEPLLAQRRRSAASRSRTCSSRTSTATTSSTSPGSRALRRAGRRQRADAAGGRADRRDVRDGDVVRSGELEIQAIATPGHCPDHCALLVNGTDCLTADCLFKGTVGGTMGGGPTGYADQVHSIMNRADDAAARDAHPSRAHAAVDDRRRVGAQPVHPHLARRSIPREPSRAACAARRRR